METEEYRRMQSLEESMWWYTGLRAVVTVELARRMGMGPRRLLDAGCGTGGLLRHLNRTFVDLSLVGVDVHGPAVMAAQQAVPQAEIKVASIDRLPFAEASFDVVTSMDVLCHRGVDERAALAEMRRCLKPGGLVLLNLPAHPWMMAEHDRQVHTERRYTRAMVAERLAAAGLRTVRTYHWNSLLFPLMVIRRKLLGRWQHGSDVIDYPRRLDRLFAGTLSVELALRRRGMVLPFGGSVFAIGLRDG
jgi:ubiquinone/menaquinone biosynthesis C-methylase UbiE